MDDTCGSGNPKNATKNNIIQLYKSLIIIEFVKKYA